MIKEIIYNKTYLDFYPVSEETNQQFYSSHLQDMIYYVKRTLDKLQRFSPEKKSCQNSTCKVKKNRSVDDDTNDQILKVARQFYREAYEKLISGEKLSVKNTNHIIRLNRFRIYR